MGRWDTELRAARTRQDAIERELRSGMAVAAWQAAARANAINLAMFEALAAGGELVAGELGDWVHTADPQVVQLVPRVRS